jgi:restriction endonuclease Mrr
MGDPTHCGCTVGSAIARKIVLIDGKQLAQLVIDYDVGIHCQSL